MLFSGVWMQGRCQVFSQFSLASEDQVEPSTSREDLPCRLYSAAMLQYELSSVRWAPASGQSKSPKSNIKEHIGDNRQREILSLDPW